MNKYELSKKVGNVVNEKPNNVALLMDKLSLTDYAALSSAVAENEISVIKKIYRNALSANPNLPDVDSVLAKYDSYIKDSDNETVIKRIAKEESISEKDVEEMVNLEITNETLYTNEFDSKINEAVAKLNTVLATGKPQGGSYISELNHFQRYKMLDGGTAMINKHLADVFDLDLDELMKKHAEIRGFETVGEKEFEEDSLVMLDRVVESILINLHNQKNKNKKPNNSKLFQKTREHFRK